MSAAFVHKAETWPDAGPLTLSVVNHADMHHPEFVGLYGDGEEKHAEVVLSEPPTDRTALVIALRFSTLRQGQRAARILADAFAAVRGIQDEAPPDPATCVHVERVQFFARAEHKEAVCERCGAYLGRRPIR